MYSQFDLIRICFHDRELDRDLHLFREMIVKSQSFRLDLLNTYFYQKHLDLKIHIYFYSSNIVIANQWGSTCQRLSIPIVI